MKTKKPLKQVFILALQLFCLTLVLAQERQPNILRSSLGNAGSSTHLETSRGVFVISQSIGQNSVIGTYTQNGYILSQGYQQALQKINVKRLDDSGLNVRIHPNPFTDQISLIFQKSFKGSCEISVHDLNGRVIYKQEHKPSQLLKVELNFLAQGTYLLTAIADGKIFRAKILKN